MTKSTSTGENFMTDAAFGFNSVSFSMQDNRAAYLQELEKQTRSTSGGGRSERKKKTPKKQKLSKKEAARLREGLKGYQPVQQGNGMPSQASINAYNTRMNKYSELNKLEDSVRKQETLKRDALANARSAEQGARFQGVTSEQIDERLGINNKRSLSGAARQSYEAKYAADLEKAFLEREAKSNQFGTVASQVADADDAAAREMRQIAQNAEKNKGLAKAGKNTGKFMKFFKSTKGKAAIITGAIALIATGVTAVACSNSGQKKPVETKPVNDIDKTEDIIETPVAPEKKDNVVEVKNEKTVETAAPITTPIEPEIKTKEYTVKKGDSVWNIAKSNLLDKHKDKKDYAPTDKEILGEVKIIMKDNNLKYEPDNYHVMIKPDDKLKLVA